MSRYWRARPGSKYGNVKVELDGHKFESKKEAARYALLSLSAISSSVMPGERRALLSPLNFFPASSKS